MTGVATAPEPGGRFIVIVATALFVIPGAVANASMVVVVLR
jgi:hypothetical protein